MKSINKLIMTFLLAVCASAQAQSDQSVLNEINELTRAIRQATTDSTASRSSLIEARNHLEDALDLIEDNSGFDKQCFDYAYGIYSISNGSSAATDKSLAACRKIADLVITRYAYGIYSISNGSAAALDKSVAVSGSNMKGKLSLLQYAYGIYSISNGSSAALDLSYQGALKVKRGSEDCVDQLYKRYSISMGSRASLDRAFEGCAH